MCGTCVPLQESFIKQGTPGIAPQNQREFPGSCWGSIYRTCWLCCLTDVFCTTFIQPIQLVITVPNPQHLPDLHSAPTSICNLLIFFLKKSRMTSDDEDENHDVDKDPIHVPSNSVRSSRYRVHIDSLMSFIHHGGQQQEQYTTAQSYRKSELNAVITPNDVLRWMNVKVFGMCLHNQAH